MKWLVKASVQKALSSLPDGTRLNYVFQRKVSKSLPASDATFRLKFSRALRHLEAFDKYGARARSEAVFYEFGAGWDLAVPLAYYALGVDRQILVDIRANLHLELIEDSVGKFERLADELEREAGQPLRRLRPLGDASVSELERNFGIRYLAPYDARDTKLPAASVDFISSTVTLEHIPEQDAAAILAECERLLRRDGVMSCRIDLQDHNSYVDKSVSRYNFLKFSEPAWRMLNSPLHYQNRLRYPDYTRLFRAAGLEVLEEAVSRPTAAELELLRTMKVAAKFRGRYSLEDLGAKTMTVAARPAGGPPASGEAS